MSTKKIVRASAIIVGFGVGVAALFGPTVTVGESTRPTARPTERVKVGYPLAKADPGGGNAWQKKFCAAIGVGSVFLTDAPKQCGEKNLGGLNPRADVCKDTAGNSLGEGGKRKCEVCVPIAADEKCNKEITVKAKLSGDITFPYPGGQVTCKAGTEYSSVGKTKVVYQNSKWNKGDENAYDSPVKFYSEIIKSSAESEVDVKIKGGCAFVVGGANVEIEAFCKIAESATFANETDRNACGKEPPKPCATSATADGDAAAATTDCKDAATADATTADATTDATTPTPPKVEPKPITKLPTM